MRELWGRRENPLEHGIQQVICAVLVGLLGIGGALAHHTFAMYDSEHQVRIRGTVSSFEWNNPHVYIELRAADHDGAAKAYTIECASPGILERLGWRLNMIKPGDVITVLIAPLKTGEPGGQLEQVTLADGRSLGNGGNS